MDEDEGRESRTGNFIKFSIKGGIDIDENKDSIIETNINILESEQQIEKKISNLISNHNENIKQRKRMIDFVIMKLQEGKQLHQIKLEDFIKYEKHIDIEDEKYD